MWGFFEFFNVVDNVNGFPHIEPLVSPWDEFYLVMMNDCFDVFLDSIFENFIVYFCIKLQRTSKPPTLFTIPENETPFQELHLTPLD
jgi:hypothetical protein